MWICANIEIRHRIEGITYNIVEIQGCSIRLNEHTSISAREGLTRKLCICECVCICLFASSSGTLLCLHLLVFSSAVWTQRHGRIELYDRTEIECYKNAELLRQIGL